MWDVHGKDLLELTKTRNFQIASQKLHSVDIDALATNGSLQTTVRFLYNFVPYLNIYLPIPAEYFRFITIVCTHNIRFYFRVTSHRQMDWIHQAQLWLIFSYPSLKCGYILIFPKQYHRDSTWTLFEFLLISNFLTLKLRDFRSIHPDACFLKNRILLWVLQATNCGPLIWKSATIYRHESDLQWSIFDLLEVLTNKLQKCSVRFFHRRDRNSFSPYSLKWEEKFCFGRR